MSLLVVVDGAGGGRPDPLLFEILEEKLVVFLGEDEVVIVEVHRLFVGPDDEDLATPQPPEEDQLMASIFLIVDLNLELKFAYLYPVDLADFEDAHANSLSGRDCP